jgi:hypothetical protein
MALQVPTVTVVCLFSRIAYEALTF